MAIVYQHRRKDTNEVFYVGIGKDEKRAYQKRSRNRYWKHIVNKYGYNIEITHRDIIWEEACSIEKYLISFWGRKDLEEGTLVNMTDGGEGVINNVTTEETRKKLSQIHKGKIPTNKGIPMSEEQKEKLRKPHQKKRKPMSQEQKEKLSQIHKGRTPWNKGLKKI